MAPASISAELLSKIFIEPTVTVCKSVLEKIGSMAENEYNGEDMIKEKLIKLQMMLEDEEITEEQYNKEETILLNRLEERNSSEQDENK